MNIEKYSTLVLGNDKNYIVAEKISFNNSTYLMLLEEKEELEEKPLFVKMVKSGLQFLKGEEEKEVLEIMFPLFESDYI